jgi:hypothetical protein
MYLTIPVNETVLYLTDDNFLGEKFPGSDGDRQFYAADLCPTFYFNADTDPDLALKLVKLI